MLTDRQRIENALIPALLEGVAICHIKADGEVKEQYKQMLDITKEAFADCFKDLPIEKRMQLYRRIDRIYNKIILYIRKEKFDTRKMFLMITEWVKLLLDYELLIIPDSTPFAELLKDLDDIVSRGHEAVDNFDKINASAINHVLSIHEIANKEGYFKL